MQVNGLAIAAVNHRHNERRIVLHKRNMRDEAGVEHAVYGLPVVTCVLA
jgi:hypothetical protein